jgi:hypothetical protein
MKKHLFPVLMLVGLLAFLGCKQDPGGDPSPGPGGDPNPGGNSIPSGNLGDGELTLGGTVYEAIFGQYFPTYPKYTGSETIRAGSSGNEVLGTGTLRNGEFNIKISKPTRFSPISDIVERGLFGNWQNPTVNPADYNSVAIRLTTDNGRYISKVQSEGSGDANNWSGTSQRVEYVYVDKDLTITLEGMTTSDKLNNGIPYTYKTSDTTLSLTKGWNALWLKFTGSGTPAGEEGTISVSVGDPDVKWVIRND